MIIIKNTKDFLCIFAFSMEYSQEGTKDFFVPSIFKVVNRKPWNDTSSKIPQERYYKILYWNSYKALFKMPSCYWQIFGVWKSTLGYVQLLQKVLNHDLKNLYVLSGSDDLLTRTCVSQRIFFIPLQKRRGNTRSSAWCRAPIPISWM